MNINKIAEKYVRIILRIGQYDPDYVDSYYGPESWKPLPESSDDIKSFPKEDLTAEISELLNALKDLMCAPVTGEERLRHDSLTKQLQAAAAKVRMIAGEKFFFDEESQLLYDAKAPCCTELEFRSYLSELDSMLPGNGSVTGRLNTFKSKFEIPKSKLDTVFQTAINEARSRTLRYISMPSEEKFSVEYVTNKPWSGYNWYKGNSLSLIQVNTDLPIYIDRAVDLAAHEGYPGHHVYNLLIEQNLVRNRGWMEFSIFPLFSPQSLIAEGTANFGIEMALPGKERIDFEREVLFPAAGLPPTCTEEYYAVYNLTQKLHYAGNEAARGYLDGKMTQADAIDWLMEYSLFSKERAEQRIRFFERYRSYVINYNLGLDIVRSHVEKKGGTPAETVKRWKNFESLLALPHTPGSLSI
jgi:hypothetical protein